MGIDPSHVLPLKHAVVARTPRKLALVRSWGRVSDLVKLLTSPATDYVLVKNVADLLGILALPHEDALLALLSAKAPAALFTVLKNLYDPESTFSSAEQMSVLLSVLRALKSIFVSLMRLVGPRVWGVSALDARHVSTDAPVRTFPHASLDGKPSPTLTEYSTPAIDSLFEEAAVATFVSIASQVSLQDPFCLNSVDRIAPSFQPFQVIEIICHIISGCVRTTPQQNVWLQALSFGSLSKKSTIIERLLTIAGNNSDRKISATVLQALSYLIRENASATHVLLSHSGELLDNLDRLFYSGPTAAHQLSACTLYVNIIKARPERDEAVAKLKEKSMRTIQTLLRLSGEPRRQDQIDAVFTLAYFINGRPDLQKIVCDLHGLAQLKKLLVASEAPLKPYPTADQVAVVAALRESVFLAIGAIAFHTEESRRSIVDAGLLSTMVDALKDPCVPVRASACQCIRALSRSINILRTGLVDTGSAMPLLQLLRPDEAEIIINIATATVANLLLEFSPMKRELLEHGVVERLVDLTRSNNIAIRSNSILALKNIIYLSPSSLKHVVVETLGWDWLRRLLSIKEIRKTLPKEESNSIKLAPVTSSSSPSSSLPILASSSKSSPSSSPKSSVDESRNIPNDNSTAVMLQYHASGFLRNLACSSTSDVEMVFRGIGEETFLDVLEELLSSKNEDTLLEALYCIVNVATGDNNHRTSIMSRYSIIQSIYTNLSHPRSDLRVAAVWIVINITQRSPEQKRISEHALSLRSRGFEVKLREMTNDVSLDVRERVIDALEGFEPARR